MWNKAIKCKALDEDTQWVISAITLRMQSEISNEMIPIKWKQIGYDGLINVVMGYLH